MVGVTGIKLCVAWMSSAGSDRCVSTAEKDQWVAVTFLMILDLTDDDVVIASVKYLMRAAFETGKRILENWHVAAVRRIGDTIE